MTDGRRGRQCFPRECLLPSPLVFALGDGDDVDKSGWPSNRCSSGRRRRWERKSGEEGRCRVAEEMGDFRQTIKRVGLTGPWDWREKQSRKRTLSRLAKHSSPLKLCPSSVRGRRSGMMTSLALIRFHSRGLRRRRRLRRGGGG